MLLSLTGAQLFAAGLSSTAHAATASAPDGRSVAVWQEPTGRFGFTDIHAQLFDASGHKIGGDILVSNALENTYDPTVAMNASGQFVVAWTLEFSTIDTDVHAALFNANGTLKAADFGVATSWKNEFDASAGLAANGSFVISYTLQFGPGDQDVHAVMFDADAHLLRDIGVAVSTANENNSHVTMTPGGSFAVSYLVDGASAVKHYSTDGQPAGSAVVGQDQGGSRQHHKPPPHPTPTLNGTLAGGYTVGANNRDAGIRYDLVGIGTLAGLGETTFSGDLRSMGSVRSGHASGVITLQTGHGSVRLDLEGPAQRGFAPLPTQFHFTVTSGTGSYSHLHASGTAVLHLLPATHALTLTIEV